MGPPDFSGGIKITGTQDDTATVLQWGRLISQAESFLCGLGSAALPAASMGPPDFSGGIDVQYPEDGGREVLQWGRLISQAESAVFHAKLILDQSLQWGRLISQAESSCCGVLPSPQSSLQWGRLISQAESISRFPAVVTINVASMGPPDFSGGIVSECHLQILSIQCFNGAA